MTLKLEQTKSFKKSLKQYRHKKKLLQELTHIVDLLVHEKLIPAKYRDHELVGGYKGIRELHLRPDDLLLYITHEGKKITLVAIGSHSEIF